MKFDRKSTITFRWYWILQCYCLLFFAFVFLFYLTKCLCVCFHFIPSFWRIERTKERKKNVSLERNQRTWHSTDQNNMRISMSNALFCLQFDFEVSPCTYFLPKYSASEKWADRFERTMIICDHSNLEHSTYYSCNKTIWYIKTKTKFSIISKTNAHEHMHTEICIITFVIIHYTYIYV